MKENKSKISKAVTYLGITFPFLFLAPLLLNLGFKAIGREQLTLGYILIVFGILIGIVALVLMSMGIKFLLDHLFDKK